MNYLVYDSGQKEMVMQKVLPFLESNTKSIAYPYQSKPRFRKNDVVVLFLEDYQIVEILSDLSDASVAIGFLPHPRSKDIFQNFGTSKNLDYALEDLHSLSSITKTDILFCNERPVLHSVSIGDVFTIKNSIGKNRFWNKFKELIGKFRLLFSLRHSGFSIHSSDDKTFDTCALGLVAVEHAESSFITKKLVPQTNLNDGMMHLIIISPRSVLELLIFLLKNLFPEKIRSSHLPEFISHIKNPCLTISNSQGVDYMVDGVPHSAKEIEIKVKPGAIRLIPGREVSNPEEVTKGKSTYRTTNLPQGETRQELITQTLPLINRASTEDFKDLFIVLRENAIATQSYLTMLVLSTVLAIFGLFSNSSPVIIGAMILAPLMAPIISLSMAVLRQESKMLRDSFFTILNGTILSLVFAALITLLIPLRSITDEIGARTAPTILDMGIAIVSGIAGAYAHAKEGIAKSLAGVAIAVALVPPLAVAGIGIGWLDYKVFLGAFLLYITNLAGIVMAGSVTFLILGFAPFKKSTRGLLLTFLLVVAVSIPLTMSFLDMRTRALIRQEVEGMEVRHIVIKDVKVSSGKDTRLSVRLVTYTPITDQDLEDIKTKINKKIGRDVSIEFITSIVR
ncbi:MAG: DUF389 domain-containing protein [Leptospira sp.]|nr:DUF389 domain-containing protein [Leptospira sp.]